MEFQESFNFKKSNIKKALSLEKNFLFKALSFKKFYFFFFLISLFLKNYFFATIFLCLFLFAFEIKIFKNYLAQKRDEKNLADKLDLQLALVFEKVFQFCRKRKIKEICPSLFLYFLLKEIKKTQLILLKFEFDLSLFLENLKNKIEALPREKPSKILSPEILEILKKAPGKISAFEFLGNLAFFEENLKEALGERNILPEEFLEFCKFYDFLEKDFERAKKFWEWENLVKWGTFGRDFAAGWTPLLDQFSFDLTQSIKKQKFPFLFAHEKEVEILETVLSKRELNNALIVGRAGSGRRSIVEALARKCALGQSTEVLNFKRVKVLDLPTLISKVENLEFLESLLQKIFEEAERAGNIILVIDNLHHYVEAKEKALGTINILPILSPFLNSPNFYFVGITDYLGLHTKLEKDAEFLAKLQKIEVSEVTLEETLKILLDRALRLEIVNKIFCSFLAIKEIISLCEKCLPNLPFPEKAIDVLDEAFSLAKKRKIKIIYVPLVQEIIRKRTQIPVGEIEEKERKILLELENLLHQRIVDQEFAIKEIAFALKRARAEIRVRKGPMGTFLFLGPTGVGKTETAKALAEIYFGSEKNMIRLDMSEFQNLEDIKRLLGEEGKEGLLTTPILENPFSLLLLDEFEKAHPKILNLFLQIFDEGFVTDGLGRKVDFKNTIIIATSNAGAELLFKAVSEKKDWEKMREELLNYIIENKIFSPELINRFDALCVFKPLSKEDLLKIAELLLKKVQKQLKEKGIEFLIQEQLKEKVVELSYDPRFGAREMQRTIQEKVATPLAEAILKGEIKKKDKVKIDTENFKVEIVS